MLDIAVNNENEFGLKPFKREAGITQSVSMETGYGLGGLISILGRGK
jgi:hypothetical protein